MYGVVSTLGSKNGALVESLWDGLEAEFGLKGSRATPYPHFSYHVAEDYDIATLERTLETFSAGRAPFEASAEGVGVFYSSTPVVYVPVVTTAPLSEFHRSVWNAVAPASTGASPYYAPGTWVPHITLAMSDTSREVLPKVLRWLDERKPRLAIKVDNLAVIQSEEQGSLVRSRFSLSG